MTSRSGFIAVAGRPNAGKSTLVNHLVGQHVAIVSPIAQTTRRLVRAALTINDTQMVFVDLPGSQRPVDRLTTRMQGAVERELTDVDAVLWVVDATQEIRGGERIVADLVLSAGVPVIVALNKVDLAGPPLVLTRLGQLAACIGDRPYAALVPVSAVTGDGCDRLIGELAKVLPEGPFWFSVGDVTDMRRDERIGELIREAMLGHVREELPHATMVEVEEVEETSDAVTIAAIIWVETESQVGIIVGKAGQMVRAIGIDARASIEQLVKRHVRLSLRVKVRRHWRDDDAQLARWGL